jgi:hypothetical protein
MRSRVEHPDRAPQGIELEPDMTEKKPATDVLPIAPLPATAGDAR